MKITAAVQRSKDNMQRFGAGIRPAKTAESDIRTTPQTQQVSRAPTIDLLTGDAWSPLPADSDARRMVPPRPYTPVQGAEPSNTAAASPPPSFSAMAPPQQVAAPLLAHCTGPLSPPSGGGPSPGSPPKPASPFESPPAEYLCSISHEVLVDPVTIETGMTFERDALMQWWDACGTLPRCPLTGVVVKDTGMQPATELRGQVHLWATAHGVDLAAIGAERRSEASRQPVEEFCYAAMSRKGSGKGWRSMGNGPFDWPRCVGQLEVLP